MIWLIILILAVIFFMGWRIYRAGPQALVRAHRRLAARYTPEQFYSETEIIKHRAWQRLAEQRKRERKAAKRKSSQRTLPNKKRAPKLLGDALLGDE